MYRLISIYFILFYLTDLTVSEESGKRRCTKAERKKVCKENGRRGERKEEKERRKGR